MKIVHITIISSERTVSQAMPKKLQTNQKAADARARKDAVKQAEKERIQKVKEDEYWKDDDRQVHRKKENNVIEELYDSITSYLFFELAWLLTLILFYFTT